MADTDRPVSPRRASHRARNWLGGDPYRDRAAHLYFLVCLVVIAVLLVLAERVDRPTATDVAPGREPLAPGLAEYVSSAGGYRFTYPEIWDVREEGHVTRLTSPDGTIDLSFRPSPTGEQAHPMTLNLRAFNRTLSNERITGSRWELIGGSLSFLVGGTATEETGRRVRFLEISVGAEQSDYAITIVVPFTSDPAEVLPRVEGIVSTFEITD